MKIARIAAVAALLFVVAPVVTGCTQQQKDFINNLLADLGRLPQIKTPLSEGSEAIRIGCNFIGLKEDQAAYVPACGMKISKIRAAVNAICINRAYLTDDVVGNYVKQIGDAVKAANKAC